MTFNFIRMDIDKVLGNHRLIKAILGVSRQEFEALLTIFNQIVIENAKSKKRSRALGGGRKGNIKSPRQKLFFILFYAKTYPTFDAAAYIFGSSKTRTHEWAHNILPMLEKALGRAVVLPKRRINTPEEFLEAFPEVREVMLDGLERPTIRSQKKKTQNKHYSGKKKRHTRKNLVVTDKKKRILILTPSKHGRVHDKKLSDKFLTAIRLPSEVSIIADTGFQGIDKQHPNALMPKKKPRGGILTDAEKAMNRLISSVRISVEHAIGGVKRFGCVSKTFRNKKGLDDRLMNVCAGLWNLHVRMT